jgi:Peptidase family S41
MFKEVSMSLFVAAVLLCGNPTHAQSPTAEPEKWREDLRYLSDELPRRHINLFHTLSPEAFYNAVNELDSIIPSLPDHEIIVRMTRLLAMVKESHTYLDWANPTRTPPFGRLPLRFLVFKDGLYVTQAAKSDFKTIYRSSYYTRAIGMRVALIGNVDIESAIQAIATMISTENTENIEDSIPRHAHRPEILHALGLIQNLEHAPITLEDAKGKRFELNLIPSPSGVIPQFSSTPYPSRDPIQLYRTRPSSQFYWYEYLPAAKTVYFQYNVCVEMSTLPFATFLSDLLNFIDTHEVEKIAVDLRRNPGGNSGILVPFINSIRARPSLNQYGKLFVLIDNGTKSSAMLNAILFKQLGTNPILVGEPTGGKPNSYGEIKSFPLPNSGLSVWYSTKFFQVLPGDPQSLSPDILIELRATDYFAGRDPVLEAVLAY